VTRELSSRKRALLALLLDGRVKTEPRLARYGHCFSDQLHQIFSFAKFTFAFKNGDRLY
jgi:hypothetical protein